MTFSFEMSEIDDAGPKWCRRYTKPDPNFSLYTLFRYQAEIAAFFFVFDFPTTRPDFSTILYGLEPDLFLTETGT